MLEVLYFYYWTMNSPLIEYLDGICDITGELVVARVLEVELQLMFVCRLGAAVPLRCGVASHYVTSWYSFSLSLCSLNLNPLSIIYERVV